MLQYLTNLACIAGGIRERASGGGATIFPHQRGILWVAKPWVKFNSTLYQSSHSFTTRVHAFATETKALTREILPGTQAITNSSELKMDYSSLDPNLGKHHKPRIVLVMAV